MTDHPRIFIGVLSIREDILNRVFLQSNLHENYVGISSHPFPSKEGYSAEAFNQLLSEGEKVGAGISIICHDDIFFPDGWFDRLQEKLLELPDTWVIAGLYGYDEEGRQCGHIHDMRVPRSWKTDHAFPVSAPFADGCCHIYNTKKHFRYDDGEVVYWPDTYAFLRAREMGTTWIIDCPVEHYCTRSFNYVPEKDSIPAWEALKKRFPGERIRNLCYTDSAVTNG